MRQGIRTFSALAVAAMLITRVSVLHAQTGWVDRSGHLQRLVRVAPETSVEVLDWGGTGRPLILLAQLGQTAHIYDDWAPRLSRSYHVIGITRRGFGASSIPTSGYAVEQLGKDIQAVLDAERIDGAILIGNGFAGEELSWLGESRAARVAGLVYLDAAYDRAGIAAEGAIVSRIPARQPTAEDLASSVALTRWMSQGIGFPVPESEVRQLLIFGADGRLTGERTPPTVRQQIFSGIRKADYQRIEVPALAIYAKPASSESFPGCRSAVGSVKEACTELLTWTLQHIAGSERSLSTIRSGPKILELLGASPFVFLSHESDVQRAIDEFVSQLAR